MAPCCHIFCQSCHDNSLEYRDRCPECNSKVVAEIKPYIIDSIIAKLKDKKRAINELLKTDLLKNAY
jgi:hypothetical protein